jgi:hypothetical protein
MMYLACTSIISFSPKIAITLDDFPRLQGALFSPLERAEKIIDACDQAQFLSLKKPKTLDIALVNTMVQESGAFC